MELDDKAKLASQRLSDAVNEAAKESGSVRDAIRLLRDMGYEPHLAFQLELSPIQQVEEFAGNIEEDFTDEDRKALHRMLIRVR